MDGVPGVTQVRYFLSLTLPPVYLFVMLTLHVVPDRAGRELHLPILPKRSVRLLLVSLSLSSLL